MNLMGNIYGHNHIKVSYNTRTRDYKQACKQMFPVYTLFIFI